MDSIRIYNTYTSDYELAATANILQRKILICTNLKTGIEFLTD